MSDQEAATELLATCGDLATIFSRFAAQHSDEETRSKLLLMSQAPNFSMVMNIQMAPTFAVRLLCSADGHEPLCIIEMFPAPRPN